MLRQLAVVKILEANRRLNKKNRIVQCIFSSLFSELQIVSNLHPLAQNEEPEVQTR